MRFAKLRSVAAMAGAGVCLLACSTLAGISDATNDTSPSDPGNVTTDGNITISGIDLDFGNVACGTEGTAKLVTLHNTGPTAVPYKVVIPDGTAFRIEGPLMGTLDAGSGLVTLKVFAKPLNAGPVSFDIVVSAGSAVQTLTAKASGAGGTFTLTPPLVSFGDVRAMTGSDPVKVLATNQGTDPVTVTGFSTSPDFAVALGSPSVTVAPKATTTLLVSLNAGAVTTSLLHADLTPSIAQKLCGAPPVLTLEGSRVNADITLGSGDFGKVNCTDQVGAKDIAISNYGTASNITYSASLPSGSPFTITGGASGTLPAAAGATPSKTPISVRPNAFGAKVGVVTDTLSIHFAGPGLVLDRTVPLTANVHGAILAAQPLSLTGFKPSDQQQFTVTNTGNETVYLSWGITSSGWGSDHQPGSLPGGGSGTGTVQFSPSASGNYTATLFAAKPLILIGVSEPAICNALPTVMLSGTK